MMKPYLIGVFVGIFILVSGVTLMATAPGIERITMGLPLTVTGMVIAGIAGLLKSKTLKDFPL